jgi:adenosylhomocysteinase
MQGAERIEWARRHMPVLNYIKAEFEKTKPLKGVNVIACLHVTVETAKALLARRQGSVHAKSA